MPACRPARWTVPGAAVLALSCVALAGCGRGSGGSSPSSASVAASSGPSSPAGQAPAGAGKLTGNFCTDFKNIGSNLPIPASATGGLSALERHDGQYLRQVAAYYDRLAAEAPTQAAAEIQQIASAYQGLARSISNRGISSLPQIEQQITSLATTGSASKAFRQLIVYVTTKCG